MIWAMFWQFGKVQVNEAYDQSGSKRKTKPVLIERKQVNKD